jgi:hypothetical protein
VAASSTSRGGCESIPVSRLRSGIDEKTCDASIFDFCPERSTTLTDSA